uniref:Reverse transcriptase n=1 Tax=Cannabis sativa TaxID=3483 RepID=A0A803QQC3_CANSA
MGFRCSRSGPRVTHLFFTDDSLMFGRANGGDTETIKRILLTYETASGQKINFEKSAITFSLNVQQVDQDGVLRVLGLTSMATHDKYLGLPTVIGRNKQQVFEGICKKCGEEAGTPEHALFFCSGLIPVWHRLGVWSVLRRCAYGPMQEIILLLFDMLSCDAFEHDDDNPLVAVV